MNGILYHPDLPFGPRESWRQTSPNWQPAKNYVTQPWKKAVAVVQQLFNWIFII